MSFICPIWLEKSDFFTATGEFAFCDRPLNNFALEIGRGLLCEKVPRKAISWHPPGK